jgi:aminomethyltransferase
VTDQELKRTALYARHRAAGARMVDFAGWEMPLSYRGILDEHREVRSGAGTFDVSHMGVVELRGPQAAPLCQMLTTNDVGTLRDGRAQYSLLCNERGGILDDVVLYRLGDRRLVLVVNAANAETDIAWLREHATAGVEIDDQRRRTALLAVQGPRAATALEALAVEAAVGTLPRFGCVESRVLGVLAIVARTGYTGEDGFEIFVPADHAVRVWNALVGAGGSPPAGLAARDTLRLEAGLLLHGSDMDATTSPFEADLGAFVKLDRGPFVGRDALIAEAHTGPPRRLVGIALRDPGVPRHGYAIVRAGRQIGVVTSGGMSPMLGRGIALGYVERPHDAVGTVLAIEVRGRGLEGEVVRRPFYRGSAHRGSGTERGPARRGQDQP